MKTLRLLLVDLSPARYANAVKTALVHTSVRTLAMRPQNTTVAHLPLHTDQRSFQAHLDAVNGGHAWSRP